jgi:hypothetical protein
MPPAVDVVGFFLFGGALGSQSKLEIAFIHDLFVRSALDAIPDLRSRLPEQPNNGVRFGPRSANATPTSVDLLSDFERVCGFDHRSV